MQMVSLQSYMLLLQVLTTGYNVDFELRMIRLAMNSHANDDTWLARMLR